MQFVARGSIDKEGSIDTKSVKEIDLAYAEVPSDLRPLLQLSNDRGEIIVEAPRCILKTDLRSEPQPDREYGFAGNIAPTHETHFGKRYLGTKVPCYRNLKFVAEEGDYYDFQLPSKHPGDEFFEGTSGSPICDVDGTVVGLVCCRGKLPDTIRGVKISCFRVPIEIESAASPG